MTKAKKPLTAEQIAHRKFLKKMGVTKKDLKARKEARKQEQDPNRSFNPDTRQSVFRSYD